MLGVVERVEPSLCAPRPFGGVAGPLRSGGSKYLVQSAIAFPYGYVSGLKRVLAVELHRVSGANSVPARAK